MENQSLGAFDISVDIIGHDIKSYTVIMRLPSGAIIPSTISRANFNKHMLPLFENPPEKTTKSTPLAQDNDTITTIESVILEAKADKPDDLWWDVDAMFQEIRWHAKNNSRAVKLDVRDVQPPRIAFKCDVSGKSWSVNIKYIHEFLDRLSNSQKVEDQTRAFQLRKCISTNEGKQRLVDSLNYAIQ